MGRLRTKSIRVQSILSQKLSKGLEAHEDGPLLESTRTLNYSGYFSVPRYV
jgi:hypothetical protein